MSRFSRYFNGSYGWDKLSKYLLIIGLIFLFTKSTAIAGILLIAYASFRSISKNKYKRQHELYAFENFLIIINKEIYRFKVRIDNFRKYKIFKCPSCSQKLRVPRKKGKITVTCKKCGTNFKGRT